MTYYKDTNNNLHYLSDEDEANGGLKLLPEGSIKTTDDEAYAIQNPYSSLQAKQVSIVISSYKDEIYSDISFTTEAGITKEFQADGQAIANIQGVLLGANGKLPEGFYWIAKDNTQVLFTFTDLQGLANAIFLRTNVAFQKLQTLKAEIATSAIENLSTIVW